jgi:SAM-dependent methyltransferase
MLSKLFLWITRRSDEGRRALMPLLFEAIARRWQHVEGWTFMNYGFAADAADGEPLPLDPSDEPERYCIQLYHRVAGAIDLAGKDVLEVSCGRGGGASYMRRYLGPRHVTAVDLSPSVIAFCRWVHRVAGLRFLQGDAEDLPIFEASVDAVVNVEASMCYGDVDRFLAEVRRVLKPGGHFLYADLRLADEVDALFASLRQCGLELLQYDDITAQVVRALRCDDARRREAIRRLAPLPLRGVMRTFAGTAGTRMPVLMERGRMRYFRFVLRRPLDDLPPPAPAPARHRAVAPALQQSPTTRPATDVID